LPVFGLTSRRIRLEAMRDEATETLDEQQPGDDDELATEA
jgi:hypothetical protein